MGFARITIIGNLGRDPEMRYTPQGRPVTDMSVAVSHSKPDGNGGWKDEGTDWYRVSVWGDRAERAAEQFRKGNRVLVAGRFKTREYERRDGGTALSLEITADDIIPAERPRHDDADGYERRAEEGGFGEAGVQPAATVPAGRPNDDLDDLPF